MQNQHVSINKVEVVFFYFSTKEQIREITCQ
jgi:hypothetical protein